MTLQINIIKRIYQLCFGILLSLFLSSMLQAQISIIASPELEIEVSQNDLKGIFSGTVFKWPDGEKVVIVDQPNEEIGTKFYDLFLGKSMQSMRKTWTKLVLSGQANAPVKRDNDTSVIDLIAKNKGLVGYVYTSSLTDDVKELVRIEDK